MLIFGAEVLLNAEHANLNLPLTAGGRKAVHVPLSAASAGVRAVPAPPCQCVLHGFALLLRLLLLLSQLLLQ
jgi:hypothetical protein